MKLLLENWRKYLNEEEQNIYSFDFDNTLIRYHTLEDGDVEYIGPHEENIQLAKNLAAAGNKVIIVTSRAKPSGPKKPWDDSPLPEELIAEFDLPIEEIYYTFGYFKADKLVELGVTKHWDDDEEEVDKGKYMKSKDSDSEIASLKKQIAELQSGIDEKIQKEADTRLRKLGFREETGLKAPEIVRYDTMGVEDTTPIQKSEEPTNVVEQLAKMSYTQLRTLQHKIQSGDTDGVPRELIEG